MASPSFRKFYVHQGYVNVPTSDEVLKRRGVKIEQHEMKVLDLLLTLWVPDLAAISSPDVRDEIERLVDMDPKARGRITPCLANLVGKISIISHCVRLVENYQPWAGSITWTVEDYKKRIDNEFQTKTPS